MNQYTPGLWEAHSDIWCGVDGCEFGHERSLVIQRDVNVTIADCGTENNSFAKANARLIAAAPELLEAAKAALQFIENGVEFGYIRMPDAGFTDTALLTPDLIRAAIAKATGVTSS